MLKGTEKQIKWAADLVNKEIKELNDILATVTSNEYQIISGYEMNKDGKTYHYEAKTVHKVEERFLAELEVVKSVVKALELEEDSKFIIENKDDLTQAISDKNSIKRFLRIKNAYCAIKFDKDNH